jgi:hypothetical protein
MLSILTSAEVRDYFMYMKQEVEFLSTLAQDDAYLEEHVRRRLLVTPAPRSQPYLLEHPNKMDRTGGQLAVFLDIFHNRVRDTSYFLSSLFLSLFFQSGGFFIEFRARDGESASPTLDLESRHNWTGVLIEPSPFQFEQLLAKKRKAHLAPICLSSKKHPDLVRHILRNPID